MNSKVEIAKSKFVEGFNCAQAVLYSFCDDLGFNKDMALKLACGFGAGMGRKEEVCGAVTGGIIAIGIKYGRNKADDKIAGEKTYEKTRELMNNFRKLNGTFICRKLLNDCELTTEEGHKQFMELNLRNTVCLKCVQHAVEILEPLIKTA
jgi:C_GCAxxG_C_C family probable redox protein